MRLVGADLSRRCELLLFDSEREGESLGWNTRGQVHVSPGKIGLGAF